jgi:hypothetical protein
MASFYRTSGREGLLLMETLVLGIKFLYILSKRLSSLFFPIQKICQGCLLLIVSEPKEPHLSFSSIWLFLASPSDWMFEAFVPWNDHILTDKRFVESHKDYRDLFFLRTIYSKKSSLSLCLLLFILVLTPTILSHFDPIFILPIPALCFDIEWFSSGLLMLYSLLWKQLQFLQTIFSQTSNCVKVLHVAPRRTRWVVQTFFLYFLQISHTKSNI